MHIGFLKKVFKQYKQEEAIVWKDQSFSYQWLLDRIDYWQTKIHEQDIKSGTVTVLEADFSPNAISLFLALIEHGCILVPLTISVGDKKEEYTEIAQANISFIFDESDNAEIVALPINTSHSLYRDLNHLKHPGLVLFSSGSTGKSKAAVHDLCNVLEKFKITGHRRRTISFLLYDHIGGVNTMLYVLSNGGTLVTVQDRSAGNVLRIIEEYKVELLPTSPTFMNMILLSKAYDQYDLSSLKLVTYGTEVMPEGTIKRFREIIPNVRLLQTYGLSEVGILKSKSKNSDSLWIKLGGEGFKTRIVDGILHIKAKSAMIGYLNVSDPFTEDGWLNTGDMVVVDGEYIRILGRNTDIINVGGEKVYPAEVESVIQEIPDVAEVTVFGERNSITGQIVCARITPTDTTNNRKLIQHVKQTCLLQLASFKVPAKIKVTKDLQHSERFKKINIQG